MKVGWLLVGVFWLIEEVLFGGFANLFNFISGRNVQSFRVSREDASA